MEDKSYLDRKYFIDKEIFNCPFCNSNNVEYSLENVVQFDWSSNTPCFIYIVKCSSCQKISMHLSYEKFYSAGPNSIYGVFH
jgi:hypothetical protein